jgi:acyl-CoA hydrolase
MPRLVSSTAAEIVASLRPGMTVYVPGMSGESLAFYAALQAHSDAAAGVRFVGVHFPGINRSDYLALHPEARQRAYFMQPGLRAGLADGRLEWLPMNYPGIYADLAEQVPVDVAIAQVTPPDEHGRCSLGPCLDFLPAIWRRARLRIGHVNPRLQRTRGTWTIDAGDLDAVFEEDAPLVCFEQASGEGLGAHAAHVAGLVRDGDTLEFGIGKLPGAILAALRGHLKLRIYSGMVTAPVAELIDCGAIHGGDSVHCGVALGDERFYARVAADEHFVFRPVSETHDVRQIGAIANFCAINSAVEVDLFGQVNADTVNGRCVAGVGGLPAFVSGARLSPGGRSIIALPATTENGKHSRVVVSLAAGTPVAAPRYEADHVVTEFGVASLRGLSLHQRARALIAIAAPQFREPMERGWAEIERRL